MKRSIYYGDMEGSINTKQGKERLWEEENIIFVGGVHAFKVIQRKGYDPLIELWHEDDEQLFTPTNNTVQFDVVWLKDLRNLIDVTIEKLEIK